MRAAVNSLIADYVAHINAHVFPGLSQTDQALLSTLLISQSWHPLHLKSCTIHKLSSIDTKSCADLIGRPYLQQIASQDAGYKIELYK